MKKLKKVDRPFLITVFILVTSGFFIFSSAALGVLARSETQFSSIIFNQTFFGLFLGTISAIIVSRVHYRVWRKYAFYIFLITIGLTLLVFTNIGFEHGGARRWIQLGNFTLQPSEFLKIGFLIYFAAWLSGVKDKVKYFRYGMIPFFIVMGVVASILLWQPDNDTLIIIFVSGIAMFITAGARWLHILFMGMVAASGFLYIIMTRPYVMDRVMTFFNPSVDFLGSSYQIQQALIAFGSGGWFGRGFGQSVQKFGHLPEPISDSIFAVIGEEFGFIGSSFLIMLFLYFAFRGLKIAARAPDSFGGLLVVGIVIMIIAQSFSHMAGLLEVFPLSGSPLLFFSHGGTALLAVMIQVGIVLNISRYQRKQ